MRSGIIFSIPQMLRFWQDFGFSVILAYVMYILIEAPCGGLESMLFPNRRPAPQPKVQPVQVVPELQQSPIDLEKQPEAIAPVDECSQATAPPLETKVELPMNNEKEIEASS